MRPCWRVEDEGGGGQKTNSAAAAAVPAKKCVRVGDWSGVVGARGGQTEPVAKVRPISSDILKYCFFVQGGILWSDPGVSVSSLV